MKARLYRCPYDALFCEAFGCRNRAAWWIGNPDGPTSICLRLCDECARAMLQNLPEELAPPAPPEPEQPDARPPRRKPKRLKRMLVNKGEILHG